MSICGFQVIAAICGGLSVVLLIICVASTAWLEADQYRQGLWYECRTENGDGEGCKNNPVTGINILNTSETRTLGRIARLVVSIVFVSLCAPMGEVRGNDFCQHLYLFRMAYITQK